MCLNKAVSKMSEHLEQNVEAISRIEQHLEHVVVAQQQTKEIVTKLINHLKDWKHEVELEITLVTIGTINAFSAQLHTESAVKVLLFSIRY